MNSCPECNYKNYEGVISCERCGAVIETTPILTAYLEQIPKSTSSAPVKFSYQQTDDEITLLFRDNPKPCQLKIEGEVLMGRGGNGSRSLNVLNLDSYHAGELGVSRRHAVLYWDSADLYIRDLNSTNHTFVNGMRVPDGRDFMLQPGDEIALGKLVVNIYF